jgi:hypothetical protein
MKYKKILATVGSVLMLGATAAGAFAANYPAPFSSEGAVVVVGADAPADMAAATNINSNLAGRLVTGTSVSVEGGDSYKVEGASDKWNLGDKATAFRSGLITKNDLKELLEDGTFRDKNNTDRRYTQEIQLNESLALSHFSDYDYKSEEPTIGFHVDDNTQVLSYALNFVSTPHQSAVSEKEIVILGKSYYILSATNGSSQKIELLDSANKIMVEEGESKSVGKYVVEISSVSNLEARLVINGEQTTALKKGSTYKLSDGSYVGIIDVVQANRERDTHKVELAIGSGKMSLTDGQSLRLNDKEDVREIISVINFTSAGNLQKIGFVWKSDREAFLTANASLILPQFESLKLQVAAINFPKTEETRIETNGADKVRLVVPIKDGIYNLDLAYANSTHRALGNYSGLGRDVNNKLVVSPGDTLTFDETNKDRLFFVSWASSTEAETYVLNARLNKVDDQNTVTVRNEITGEEFCKDLASGTCRVGRTDLSVSSLNATTGNLTVTFTKGSADSSFNTIYTAEGLKIGLPSVNENSTAFNLTFTEENKDGKIGLGHIFTTTLGITTINSENRTDVKSTNATQQRQKVPNQDEYISYVQSELATEVYFKQPTTSQNSIVVTYHGDEVSADVWVTAASASAVSEVGTMVATDAETAKITGKNLIVVGGSAINSVAANLLGGAYSGAEFTTATGVGANQFLIQSFAREGKIALLVAGYEADDTTKAATYLINNVVDTAVGAKEIKSSTVVASTE